MSTFDGSKVNGLANALQSYVAVSNPINSETSFEYFKNVIPDMLKSIDSDRFTNAMQASSNADWNLPLLGGADWLSYYEYNEENGTWGTEIKKGNKMARYYIPIHMIEPLSENSAVFELIIGIYTYTVTLTLESDAYTGDRTIVVENGKWAKIAF